MIGGALAIAAAMAYGVAGVLIVNGRRTARGDNGVFLSVVLTAALACALWLGWGNVSIADAGSVRAAPAPAVFAAAGMFSTVFGRTAMFRATERIGAVRAGLLRRLTPVFAIPFAFALLGETPGWKVLLGGGLILVGVYSYLGSPERQGGRTDPSGVFIGIGSAASYALAYALRRLGLDVLPDAALGAFIGALAGLVWFPAAMAVRRAAGRDINRLVPDLGGWQIASALLLSAGQILQFFALKSATVATVAVLGSLDVLFSALVVMAIRSAEPVAHRRLVGSLSLAVAGSALIFLA